MGCPLSTPPTEKPTLTEQDALVDPGTTSRDYSSAGASASAAATPPPPSPKSKPSWRAGGKRSVPDIIRSAQPLSPTAKPVGKFQFLDRKYGLETPSCLIPRVNELFKSICERYDIAVTNREKVDEALALFKRVIEVDPETSMAECFAAWKAFLTNPHFTVKFKQPSGDVKEITVRADEVPRSKRKAQKHIRDLLDACDLFLQQREFLQRHLREDLTELDRISKDLPSLSREHSSKLSLTEQRQLPRVIKSAQSNFAKFPNTIDTFWEQVYSLMYEINTSVHVLTEE